MLNLNDIENLLSAIDSWESEDTAKEMNSVLVRAIAAHTEEEFKKALNRFSESSGRKNSVRRETCSRLRVKLYDMRDELIDKEVKTVRINE